MNWSLCWCVYKIKYSSLFCVVIVCIFIILVCKVWFFDFILFILFLFDINVKVFENVNEVLFDIIIEWVKLEEEVWRRENDWEKVEVFVRERWWELGVF